MVVQSQFIEMFGDPITNSKGRKQKPFIEVVTLHRGYDLPEGKRVQSGSIPIYGANGFLGYHDCAMAKDGIVTGRSGAIGEVYEVPGPYWPLNTALFSIDTHGNNITYLTYLLRFFDIKRFGTGTGVPTLNRNDVHKEMIYDVELTEQSAFEKIAKQADKSKFDGLKSQFIEMTKATSSIKLEDVAKDVFAGGDKPKDYSAVQGELYKYPVFSNGIGDNALLCFSKECRVKEAAITVSARGTIGYAECREAGFTPVVRLLTLIPKDGYQLSYLKFALNNVTFHSTGSSQGQLTAPDFCKYEIPNAPKDVQLAFGSIVHQADKSKYLS